MLLVINVGEQQLTMLNHWKVVQDVEEMALMSGKSWVDGVKKCFWKIHVAIVKDGENIQQQSVLNVKEEE